MRFNSQEIQQDHARIMNEVNGAGTAEDIDLAQEATYYDVGNVDQNSNIDPNHSNNESNVCLSPLIAVDNY